MPDEQTILGIANDTRNLLRDLESRLDGALRRNVAKEKDSGMSVKNPSIVGEIIDLMQSNNRMLGELSEQIRAELLVRLDRLDRPARES